MEDAPGAAQSAAVGTARPSRAACSSNVEASVEAAPGQGRPRSGEPRRASKNGF
uniref:Uncharacterized protein n=1 Tax=Arundo donax TaxID=35708 RepID=A0A0A9BHH2_ARUDO